MLLLLSGIGIYKLHLVSLVLKEPQSDAVELKPWMTTFDFLNDLLLCSLPVYYEAYRNPKRSCLSIPVTIIINTTMTTTMCSWAQSHDSFDKRHCKKSSQSLTVFACGITIRNLILIKPHSGLHIRSIRINHNYVSLKRVCRPNSRFSLVCSL